MNNNINNNNNKKNNNNQLNQSNKFGNNNNINILRHYNINAMCYSSHDHNNNHILTKFGNLSKFIYYDDKTKEFIITIKISNILLMSEMQFRKNFHLILDKYKLQYMKKLINYAIIENDNDNHKHNQYGSKKIKIYLYKTDLVQKVINDLLILKDNFKNQHIMQYNNTYMQIINHNYKKYKFKYKLSNIAIDIMHNDPYHDSNYDFINNLIFTTLNLNDFEWYRLKKNNQLQNVIIIKTNKELPKQLTLECDNIDYAPILKLNPWYSKKQIINKQNIHPNNDKHLLKYIYIEKQYGGNQYLNSNQNIDNNNNNIINNHNNNNNNNNYNHYNVDDEKYENEENNDDYDMNIHNNNHLNGNNDHNNNNNSNNNNQNNQNIQNTNNINNNNNNSKKNHFKNGNNSIWKPKEKKKIKNNNYLSGQKRKNFNQDNNNNNNNFNHNEPPKKRSRTYDKKNNNNQNNHKHNHQTLNHNNNHNNNNNLKNKKNEKNFNNFNDNSNNNINNDNNNTQMMNNIHHNQ